jgi:hypothetical protein
MKKAIILFIFSILTSQMFAQSTGQGCVVNPSMVSPSGVKYTGGCLNGLAEGDGTITFSNGNTISGKFSKNILQEGIVEFYFSEDKSTIIGPYKNGKLNGRFVGVDKMNRVYSVNYLDGRAVEGRDDLFNFPEPKMESTAALPVSNLFLPDVYHEVGQTWRNRFKINIPFTELALIKRSGRPIGSKSDVTWLSLYDYRNNQIIRDFGDLNNPIDNFLCFDPDYTSIFAIQSRKNVKGVYKFNLTTGASEYVSRVEDQKILATSLLEININDFNPDFEDGKLKFGEINHASNLIYSFTNSGMFKLGNMKSTFSVSKLTGEQVKELKFEGSMIRQYSVNELANQLYISFKSNDQVYISLYKLDSFEFVKTIFTARQVQTFEELTISPLGTYVAFANKGRWSGSLIYKGDKFYYPIKGRILSFNTLENVVIAHEINGNVSAYDLENRKLLWMTNKLGLSTEPIKIDNNLIFISRSWESTPNGRVDLVNFELPDLSQTFFSLNMEVQNEIKRQNEEIAKAERLRKEQELKSQEEKKNEEKKATDAMYQKMAENYLLWIFKEALSGSSGSSRSSSNNPSSYSNQNVHNSYQCNRCALVSRSTKEPSGADFGRCNGFSLLPTISSVSHDWNKANTNKGWQCTSCGIKSFLIKGEPGAWEFGGNGACNGGSHRWRSF